VSVRRTLALLDAVLEEIERHRGSALLSLPVVHDALTPEEGLIASTAAQLEGVFIRIADREEGAVGPLNRPLAELVEELLRRARLEVQIREAGDRLVATYLEHPEPSGGLEILLRLAEVVVSSEIDTPTVFVTYPVGAMDSAVAQVAWELTGMTVAASPPARLKTFVPIAGGEVSVTRHCRPQNPVRFAVQEDRLIRRGRATDLDAAVRAVLLQRDQPLVLFLGAGASASAGISIGDPIRDEALRRLVGQQATTEDLIDAFMGFLAERDRWRPGEEDLTAAQFRARLTLERVLREEFFSLAGRSLALSPTIQRITAESERALDHLPDGRQALRRLITRLPRLIIATVNFDRLVEDGLECEHQVLADPASFESHRELVAQRINGQTDTLPILKLHGTIENPDTIVATTDKTEFGLPSEIAATMDAMLSAAGGPLTWVWIGCSMRDVDLRIWLGQHDGSTEMTEWWVDPLPSQTLFEYARYLREGYWATVGQTLRDRLITETADVFLSRLNDQAASLA
jgi:SIR2-like domain